MGKTRVYEYAKSNNISSKDVIEKLKGMNIEVTNHMSTIDGNAIEKLDSIYKNNKKESNSKNNSAKHKNHNQQQNHDQQKKEHTKSNTATRINNMEDEEDIVTEKVQKPHTKQKPQSVEGKKINKEDSLKETKVFNKNKKNLLY